MKTLPIGISDFQRIRKEDMFYVDKTMLISDFFRNNMFFILFTRPRRFGKSLLLSMFHHFLEIGTDSSLFDGLQIMEDAQVVREHMGKYPVIHLSFKSVNQDSFLASRSKLCTVLGSEALRFSFLLDSPHLSTEQKEKYRLLIRTKTKMGIFMGCPMGF